jgi:hypothetical protein
MSREKLMRLVLVLVVTLTAAGAAGVARAIRAIPDDNLAYPVLIKTKSELGSGFFLNTATASYLVTAKHMFYDPTTQRLHDTEAELISYPRDLKDSGRNVFVLDLAALEKTGDLRAHKSEDIAVAKISNLTPLSATPSPVPTPASGATISEGPLMRSSPIAGVTLKEESSTGVVAVGLDSVKKFSQVLTGNEVVVFGYPTSLGLQNLPQLDLTRPLLRKGIIAGQNLSSHSIVLDCPSYQGNSGGPVLEVEPEGFSTHFWVIGVVVQSVPFVDTWVNIRQGYTNSTLLNSGYSIATPMDPVLELIKQRQ